MADERGDVWEFDRGPGKSSGWPELFAATPNYRGLGAAVYTPTAQVFRWPTGPMFYRGRLDGSARVMLVGQEGAQDESLSHRSFTGGTGGHMQHFLRYLGIDRSYVFFNTFVYPIHGQYDNAKLKKLAQNPVSPIVVHRQRIFDKLQEASDLRLVVAVGTAAKESIATWITAHGGTADPDALENANGGDLPATLRCIGVLHPGGGKDPAQLKLIKADFKRASELVATWIASTSSWLPADTGVTRDLTVPFTYAVSGPPYRDFPFGTCPRLGDGSTSSNRYDGGRSIRLFGEGGSYNFSESKLTYGDTRTGSPTGYSADAADIAVEPPRAQPREFDPGPTATMARLLLGASPALPWPDFAALGMTADPTYGVGPIYRGRFKDLLLVVLTDPAGADDLFTGRALTGEAGQFFQGFLDAAGVARRYLILRTVPVDVSDLSATKRDAIADHPNVRALHTEIFKRVLADNPNVVGVLAMGRGARRLAPHVVPASTTVIDMKARGESGASASWQSALTQLSTLGYTPEIPNPTFTVPSGRRQIPRYDLPYGTPRWLGTSGDRASRPTQAGTPSASYLKLYLPDWVMQLPTPPLSAAEQAAVNQL